jgi:hypothetical protein
MSFNGRDAGKAPLLALVPVFILFTTLILIHVVGEYDADPSYGPLMSALNLMHFEAPGYLDHPGTPIHILGAFVLTVMWLLRLPFVGFSSPDSDILLNPNTYLYCANIVIAILIGAANYFLGRQLLRATGSAVVAIAGQLAIFLAFPYLLTLPMVTPDSLIIFTTTLFVALLVPAAFSAHSFQPDTRYGILVGAVFGLCLATKITCGPLCFLLLFLRERRVLLYAVGAAATAFFILILPGIALLPGMIRYYFVILTHNGPLGNGAAGTPSAGELFEHFKRMIMPGAGLLATLVIIGLLLIFRVGFRVRTKGDFDRLFVLSGLTMLLQFALVLKTPGDRYLEPAYAVTFLVYPALVYLALLQRPPRSYFACAAIFIFMGLIGLGAMRASYAYFADMGAGRGDDQALLQKAAGSGCKLVTYYNAPIKEFRLAFGDETAGGTHAAALAKLYPGFLTYQSARHRFMNFSDVLEPDQAMEILHAQKCIYMFGSVLSRFGADFGISPSAMTLIGRTYHGDSVSNAIYQLRVTPSTTWKDLGLPK